MMGGLLKLFIFILILALVVVTQCKNEEGQQDTKTKTNNKHADLKLNARKPRSLYSTLLPTSAPWYTTRTTDDWYRKTSPLWYTANRQPHYTTHWHKPYTTEYPRYTTYWHKSYATDKQTPYTTLWYPKYKSTTYYTKPWYYRTTKDWRHHTTPMYHHPNWLSNGLKTTPTYPYWTTKGWNTTPWYYKTGTSPIPAYPYWTTKGWKTTPWYYKTGTSPTSAYPYWTTKGWKTTPWYYKTETSPTTSYPFWTTKGWNTTPWYYKTKTSPTTSYPFWTTKGWNTTPYGPAVYQLLKYAVVPQCISSGWAVVVSLQLLRQAYPLIQASDIYLGEPSCTGSPIGSDLSLFHSYQGCQTIKTVRDNKAVYTNRVIYAPHGSAQWTVEVECDIERTGTATAHIHHDHNATGPHVTGFGSYDVRLAFYSDSSFIHQLSGSPLHVPVGSQVYTKVFTTAYNWDITMKVYHCYMRTGNGEYDLIKNGCPLDHDTHYILQSTHETRFTFKTFQNKIGEEGFDVRCHVIFCGASDSTPGCQRTCNTNSVLIG